MYVSTFDFNELQFYDDKTVMLVTFDNGKEIKSQKLGKIDKTLLKLTEKFQHTEDESLRLFFELLKTLEAKEK